MSLLVVLSPAARRVRGHSGPVGSCRIGEAAIDVAIVMANPRHRKRQSVFVTTLGHQIEVVVCPDGHLGTPRVSRISVKDVAVLIFIEHANPWRFLARKFGHLVVVIHFALCHFFLSEGRVEVVVEISPERRHPVEEMCIRDRARPGKKSN